MRKYLFWQLSVIALAIFGQSLWAQKPMGIKDKLIGKHELTLESNIMTPEVLWAFGRVSDVQVSPDGKKILYGVSYYSKTLNRGNRELFVMDIDGSNQKQLTFTGFSEWNALWTPDGQRIGFICAADGGPQIWEMNPDGSDRHIVSDVEGGVIGFKYSPDGQKVLFIQEVKVEPTVKDIYPDLPKSSGRINDDLMYRHWDTWVDTYTHVFVADYTIGMVVNSYDIMPNEPWESPMKPFGGMEQIEWAPDSKHIAYTCRKLKGKEYSLSTNSDIYLYNIDTKETRNLTQGMMGYDMSPVFSPDGNMMAWESMERDGYEADKQRLFTLDLRTGEKKDHTTQTIFMR